MRRSRRTMTSRMRRTRRRGGGEGRREVGDEDGEEKVRGEGERRR